MLRKVIGMCKSKVNKVNEHSFVREIGDVTIFEVGDV